MTDPLSSSAYCAITLILTSPILHLAICLYIPGSYKQTHTLTHTYTHPHTHTCIYILTHTHTYTHTLAHTPTHTHVYTHTHTHTHTYTHTHSCTHTHTHTHTVMLSQVVNSTLYQGQSSTQPYATPTSAQPSLSNAQFSGSGYPNESYIGGFSAPPPNLSRQPQQPLRTPQGFPLSPTTFLNTQSKGDKPVGGASPNLPGIPGTNYPMKNESSFDGAEFPPSQQDMYGSFPQQPMVPPQGYGAMSRTDVASPEANYGMPLKDETSIGAMGQFLNQFLSDPLNPSQVTNQPLSDSSQCYQQSGGNRSQQQQQQGLPSSSMFQFPTSPLQQGPRFESSTVGTLPSLLQQQPQPPSGDSSNQPPIFRVSSAGNLGTLSTTESPSPIRPPLSRGKSEPIRHLQQQVKFLAQENERQMMEIEKQQSMAEQQYMAVLQQVAEQQASGKTSQEQRDVLKRVFSDPGLVSLLRDILLANPPPSSLVDRGEEGYQRSRLPPLSLTPTKMSSDSGAHVSSTPSPLISPSQTSQVSFNGRIIV